jgi:hypothetical protein
MKKAAAVLVGDRVGWRTLSATNRSRSISFAR